MTKVKRKLRLGELLGVPCEKEEVMELLQSCDNFRERFGRLEEQARGEIVAFLRGRRGLALRRPGVFRWLFDLRVHGRWLEEFLSAVLGEKMFIEEIVGPEENLRFTMGMRLADGARICVELQLPEGEVSGERGSCLAADLVMREYERYKRDKGENFTFQDLRPIYLILLMNCSGAEFWTPGCGYVHRQQITFDSGAKVNSLSRIIYISLDTFTARELYEMRPGKMESGKVESMKMKSDETAPEKRLELDSWLTFLCTTEPAQILELAVQRRIFREIYGQIRELRREPATLLEMHKENSP